MAQTGITKSTDIQVTARAVDFATRFALNWDHMREILGIMRPVRKEPGTYLRSKYAEVTLETSTPGEGEAVAYSQAIVKEKDYAKITLERYAKSVTDVAIEEHGFDVACEMTDEQFIFELQNNVYNRWIAYLKTGTLTEKVTTFQMALAKAQGKVRNKFKAMHRAITKIVGFCNILDVYDYLGAANIYNVENAFGLNYIKNFMGFDTLFLLSDAEIPQGMVLATPVENIVLYYVSPTDDDLRRSSLVYQTAPQGVTNYIGISIQPKYDTGERVTYAMLGMTLFSEYLDGIAKITFGDSPDIQLDKTTASVDVEETVTLTATTVPAGETVTWTSSDEEVATVAAGVVTGVAAGTATITATITVEGTDYSATCEVTVAGA